MPHSGVSDVDECAVVGLQGNSHVLLQDAIRACKQPVAAIGKHLSTKPRAFKRAANGWIETPSAARRRTDVTGRCDEPGNAAQKFTPERLYWHCYLLSR
jgi:hypothetical protein